MATLVINNDLQYYRENICSDCPGTLWGEKSICRIHNKSIGQIDYCQEWQQDPSIENNSQLALFDLEPAIEIVQRVEEELKDYHWMVKEIERLEDYLNKVQYVPYNSNRLVAGYGIEASMPKPQGKKPASLSISEELFDKKYKRLEKLRGKVLKINTALYNITDEKERTVLECILDGMQMKAIAIHVGISRTRLNEIKRILVKKLAWEIYGDELSGK